MVEQRNSTSTSTSTANASTGEIIQLFGDLAVNNTRVLSVVNRPDLDYTIEFPEEVCSVYG